MGRGYLTPQEIELKKTISLNLNNLLNSSQKKKVDIHREVGIPKSTITDYFKGNSLPSKENVAKLAEFFNVPDYEIDPRFKKNTDDEKEHIDLTGISRPETEEKIFSYEGKEIPKRDLELIRRILETGEYDE
ncbi:MAG TPA: XRE family transcriptional regulator [Lactobacillus sp.]|uniref:helix-turn-helix domain-containing protein n=1 Tax=Ligilactobacillus murinus TaxID=1622 RepID=UPI00096E192C|nr:helix-turn-helix transcriptional regulator [Ligilactobacillus murinus]HAP23499.1 XRE family transcriptional regulator [Lactobacillus sp.]